MHRLEEGALQKLSFILSEGRRPPRSPLPSMLGGGVYRQCPNSCTTPKRNPCKSNIETRGARGALPQAKLGSGCRPAAGVGRGAWEADLVTLLRSVAFALLAGDGPRGVGNESCVAAQPPCRAEKQRGPMRREKQTSADLGLGAHNNVPRRSSWLRQVEPVPV